MKKTLFKILILIMASVLLFSCFAGCDVITTDLRKDMAQVVAEVNIGKDKEELKTTFKGLFKDEFSLTDENVDKILSTDAEVTNLDLISYFINYGSSYVQNGYSYADTFELLINSLTSRQIVIQFATLYYINAGKVVVDADSVPDATDAENGTVTIKSDITVDGYLAAAEEGENEALKYLLSEDNYNYALYTLRKSINSALDSYETTIIKEEDKTTSTETDRAIPTGADTEEEYSYPKNAEGKLNYEIYTGYNTADACGDYEKLDNSTVLTRKKAYNKFIKSLENNYMLEESDDISKIEELPYFATEIKNQLQQMIINNFYGTLLISRSAEIKKTDMENKYTEIYNGQQSVFSNINEYTTALDSVAADNFILYSPASGFGFVYNILLPFSTYQSEVLLKNAQNNFTNYATNPLYYIERNKILQNVTTTDQRSSWFNGTTDYSYKAKEDAYFGQSGYLFFEDAKDIDKYYGKYSYNGTVVKNDDDSYTLNPVSMKVDQFITEMEDYLSYVLGSDFDKGTTTSNYYNKDENSYLTTGENGNQKINYENFIYYKNQIDAVSSVSRDNYLKPDSVSYKALSAMNELQFAYTTDVGILNKYLGYSVAGKGYSTSYVKEFEYAAQYALEQGAGTMVMCATDYGWHLIYVAFAYDEGETYSGYDDDKRNVEGTFSNMFYNAYKDVIAEEYANTKQSEITTVLKDASVKVYKSRYKDLTTLDL